MSFEELARAHGLKDKTISSLIEEDYDSAEALLDVTMDDMEHMKITLGQQKVIQKWIKGMTQNIETHSQVSVARITKDVRSSETPTTETPQTSGSKTIAGIGAEASHTSESATPHESYEKSLGLSEDAQLEIDEYIKQNGVKNLDKVLKRLLNRHQSTQINIAVTGQTGSGKSSFINCVRNLTGDDKGAAAVGVKETTMQPEAYPDPEKPNIVFWDLPGIGTANFPRKDYLKLVDFEKYDFFLILSSERFKQDDLYLAKCVHDMNKKFYFLRTKIDEALRSDEQHHPKTHDPKQVMIQIRDDCVDNLKDGKLPTDNIFLVSSFLVDRTKYDFPRLMNTIVRNASANKRLSLVFSLAACSEEIIDEKKADLEERIPIVARQASTDEPFLKRRQDRILDEINFYKKQFGLTKQDMLKMGVDQETLTEKTTEILGPAGDVLLVVGRGILTVLSAPAIVLGSLTGKREELEIRIAKHLKKTLDRCAEAAREILRAGIAK